MVKDIKNKDTILNNDEIVHAVRDATNEILTHNDFRESISRCLDSFHSMQTRHDSLVMAGMRGVHNVLPINLNFRDFGVFSHLGMNQIRRGVNQRLSININDTSQDNMPQDRIGTFFDEIRDYLIKTKRYDGKIPPPPLQEISPQQDSSQALNIPQFGEDDSSGASVNQGAKPERLSQPGDADPQHLQGTPDKRGFKKLVDQHGGIEPIKRKQTAAQRRAASGPQQVE